MATKRSKTGGSRSIKSGKSKSTVVQGSIRNVDWKQYVNSRVINAYTWSVHVVYLVEFNSDHIKYLDTFNEIAANGQRSCINIISQTTLINSLYRYSNNNNSDDLHPELRFIYPAAAEEAIRFMLRKSSSDIPIEFLAKLIKLEILRLKFSHITLMEKKRRHKLELKDELNEMLGDQKKCNAQTIKSLKPGTVSLQNPFPLDMNSKDDKYKNETSTKLFKRGEEWKQWDDIDDSPKSGPNLYVVLSMFYDPKLIIELIHNDIPVIGIIQMRRDNDTLDNLSEIKADRTNSATYVRRISDIHNFWHNYAKLIKSSKYYAKLENTAFVTFKTPIYRFGSKKNISDIDRIVLYNDLSYAIYEIEDILRQYATFMKHMRILQMHDVIPPLSKFTIYNGMLNVIPTECITIPIILNCMLEQVSNITSTPESTSKILDTNDNITFNSSEPESHSSTNTSSILSYFGKFKTKYLHIFNKIAKNTASLIETNRKNQIKTKPFIIEYGNEIKYKTFHIEYLNLEEVTLNILFYHLIPSLWRSIPNLPSDEAILYDCHITKLLQETPNKTIDKDVLWHYLHIKVLEKMMCTSIKKISDGSIDGNQNELVNSDEISVSSTGKQFNLGLVEKLDPLNKSYATKNLTLNDILFSNDLAKLFSPFDTDLKSVSNIFNIKKYTSYEHLNSSVMLQNLYNASLKFNCIDYHYFEFTDVLLLQFHNSCPKNGIVKDDWEVFIPTGVCFRDFVSYVYNEHQEWIKQYEIRYKQLCAIEEKQEAKRLYMQKFNEELLKIAPDTLFNESLQIVPEVSDYLLPGSIKELVYKQKQEELDMISTTHDRRSRTSSTGSRKKKKSGKEKVAHNKNRSFIKLSPQQQIESNLFPAYPPDSPYHKITLPVYPADENMPYEFIGYNLGTNRIQFNGQTQYFYSSDQSFVKIDTAQKTYADEKHLAIEICKHGHSLYLYSLATTEPSSLKTKEFMFHITANNGAIITFSTPKPLTLEHDDIKSKTVVIKRDLMSLITEFSENKSMSPRKLSKVIEDINESNHVGLPVRPLSSLEYENNIQTPDEEIVLQINDKFQADRLNENIAKQGKNEEKRLDIYDKFSTHKSLDKQSEINNRFRQRLFEEKRLNSFLQKEDNEVLKLKDVKESTFLQRKSQFLAELEEAQKNRYPCYKIHSSKLHTYRYIKRIKPYITVNIRGVLKKIIVKSKLSYSSLNFKRVASKISKTSKQNYEKWKKISSKFQEPTIPLHFILNCSWPNGLCVKTVQTSDNFMPYYIKQWFLPSPENFEELSRCFLSNGQLLIFYKEGRMKILCSDSTIYNCQVDGFKPISLKPNIHKKRHYRMTTMSYKFRKILKQNVHLKKHLISSQYSLRIPYSRRMYLRNQKYCYRIASKQFKNHPDRTPIPEFSILTAEGDRIIVRNNLVCGTLAKYFVDITTDLSHNEVYIEREDGTTTFLHGENGTMNVLYPDGTRITTWFEIEEKEIVVDFTDKEYQDLVSALNNEKLQTIIFCDDESNDSEEDLVFEPFISVILVCTFEHPKYARVNIRNGIEFNTEISMLDDVTISLDRSGQYVCDIDDCTKLSLLSSMICFEQVTCCSCSTKSRSIINYVPFLQNNYDANAYYVCNINTVGHEIYIDFDGNVINDNVVSDITDDASHRCKSYMDNKSIDRRFFLLKREFDGTEFISEIEQKQYLNDCIAKKYSSIYNDENDNTKDYSIIVTYGIDKTYSETWLQPLANSLPMYLKRKDTLPSTYYPDNWLSPYHNRESNLINMNYFNSCCMDALYLNQPVPSISDPNKLPIAIIRRNFLSLLICCDQNIKVGPLFSSKADGSVKVYRALKRPYKPIFRQSSALDFRDRWIRQQSEADYYKQLLQKRHVPKYFSTGMETIMFDVECQSATILSSKTDPMSSCRHTPRLSLTQSKQFTDYKIDLIEIAKKWKKHGYIRYQPQFKKFMSTATQTECVYICPRQEDAASTNDETSEFCTCHKKSRIPIYERSTLIHRKVHSMTHVFDESVIKARSFNRPSTVCGTGNRPLIQRMHLKISPKDSCNNSNSYNFDDEQKIQEINEILPTIKPATVRISKDLGVSKLTLVEHKIQKIPTLSSSCLFGSTFTEQSENSDCV